MATTTNFGWDTPDDTDLVKDGAAAIRTALNGVDTSFVDLKGGTTGQVLAKATDTDLDFSWVAQDDSNAIQNAIVDAKGDLIGATANDTPARLAVGTDGQILTADSTAATGLAWTTLSTAPTYSGVSLFQSASTTSIANNTYTALLFDSENFDSDGYHSTSTNTSRITIPAGKAGKYAINATFFFQEDANGSRNIRVYKNGTAFMNSQMPGVAVSQIALALNLVMDLAVSDYIEIYLQQNSGISRTIYGGSTPIQGIFCASLIGV
jgi:hypothetical protein